MSPTQVKFAPFRETMSQSNGQAKSQTTGKTGNEFSRDKMDQTKRPIITNPTDRHIQIIK